MRSHNRLFAGILALVLASGTALLAGCASCSASNEVADDEAPATQATSSSDDTPQPEQADPLWVLSKEEYRYSGTVWGDAEISGITEYQRDERGNILTVTSAEGLTSYEFDKNGNPTKVSTESDANEQGTTTTDATPTGAVGADVNADALGIVDMEAEESAGTEDDAKLLADDPAEQAAEASQTVAAITHEFDDEGRLVRTTIEGQSSTEYTYDDEGRVRTVSNVVTTPDFDEDGNEAGVLTYTDTIEYDENGFPTRETRDWGDGAPTTVTYDYELGKNGLPQSGTSTQETPLETTTNQISFAYDDNGNIIHYEQVGVDAAFVAEYTWELVEKPSEYVRMQSTMRLLS